MLKAVALEGLVAFAVARYLPQAVPAFTLFSTTALFFLTFGIQTSLHFMYAVVIYPYHISPLRNIPGPPGGSLIFGHGAKEIGKSAGVIHSDWLKMIENPNPNFMRYMGFFGQEKIVPLSAEAYRAILTDKSFEMPGWFREGAKTLLGDGLVLAEGPSHTFQRKRIAPAFSQRQIRSIIPAFWKNCQVLNQLLRDVIKNDKDHSKETTTINMLDWTNRVTFDMIGDTTFGANFEGLKNPGGFYEVFNRNYPQEGFTNPLDAICMNVLPIFVPHDLLNHLPLPRYQAQLRDREIIRSECKKLIDKIDVSKLDQAEGAEQANLLTVIVNNGEMDLNLMLENMMTFIAAGFGTNAASLLWGLHALATHPEIQTRLRKEIRDTLKTSDAELNSTIMDSMKYLHWVVMENARLYPSIPGNWRTAMKEVNVLGQTFPKGTELIISAYIANRNKASWGPDAEEFNPERWSDANRKVGVEHDGQFMTYSLGHKACIGKEYSVRAIKAVFIALIGNFEFEFKGKKKMGLDDLVPGLTMRPLNGLDCEVKLASPW